MIRATLDTDKGPVAIIGINAENMVRMRAGLPLQIDLKEITPPGKRINRVVVHYAETYEQVVRDMMQEGLLQAEKMLDSAKAMDEHIAREKRERERGT